MREFVLPPVISRGGRYCFVILAAFLLMITLAQPVSAQVSKPLDRRISFKVENVSLSEALRKFKEQLKGVHISYNQALLNNQPAVTVNLSDKKGSEVLEKILSGSTLVFIADQEGNIILVSKEESKLKKKTVGLYEVSGQVVDAKGDPLPNASIMITSEKRGLTTDAGGVFNLALKQNEVLVFSYLGMKPERRTVNKDGFMKIALDTAPAVMTEFIVTGYQKIDKRMMTGAVTVLKSEDFMQPGVASVAQMLQGKVPGMTTVFNSGSPSATPKIRIRGTSTILGNAAPLWVVDDIIREDNVNMNPLQLNAALADAANSNFAIVGNAISGVNPNDIESITVLKDAAATSIYGVRAANGVIVVKTKRGKVGPTYFNYSTSVGVTGRPSYDQMYLMNSQERVGFSKDMIRDGIRYGAQPTPVSYEGLVERLNQRQITQEQFAAGVKELEYNNTDWLKMFTRNAINHTHSLSLSGGTGKTAYYFSVGYNGNKGAMKGDDMELYSARANLDMQPTSKLRISVGLDASFRKSEGFFNLNPLDYALQTSRTIRPDEYYRKGFGFIPLGPQGSAVAQPELHYNMLNEMAQSGLTSSSNAANLSGNWNYRPMRGLTVSGTYGLNTSSNTSFSYQTERSYAIAYHRGFDYGDFDKGTPVFENSPFPYGGVAYPSNNSQLSYTARHQLTYDLQLFGNRDQVNVSVAHEVRSTKGDGMMTSEIGYYPDRGNSYYTNFTPKGNAPRHTVVSTNTIENFISWMGMLSYRLMGKYTFYGNVRTDGSNRFGQYSNQRFLPNWSLSGRWDVHAENWFKNATWLTQLSVRASYGSQGAVVSQVGPNLIAQYPSQPFDPRSGESLLALKSLPYPELTWEKSKSTNLGVDASLFEGRVNITWNIYSKKTDDLLLTRKIGQEYGMESMLMNYGSMKNSGWDGAITVTPIRKKDFEWSQSFNFSFVKNQVGESQPKFTLPDYLNGTVVIPGTPLESFYSYNFIGLSGVNGTPQFDFRHKKEGYDETDPASFLLYSGPKDPTMEFGSNTSIRYKRFSAGAFFVVKMGNKRRLNKLYGSSTFISIPGSEGNLTREYLDRWRQPGDERRTNIPAFVNAPTAGWEGDFPTMLISNNGGRSIYNWYDLSNARLLSGNFVRCTNVSVSYTFPDRSLLKYRIKSMNVSGNVSNPFIIADKRYRGQDPEAANIGGSALPITQSYSLSLGITF